MKIAKWVIYMKYWCKYYLWKCNNYTF